MTRQQSFDSAHRAADRPAWERWRRTVLAAAAVLVIAGILYVARGALFPFIISIVLAELLYPVVVFLEERLPGHDRVPQVTRIVSILVIYAAFAGIVAGILYITIPPLFSEAQELVESFPGLYERARFSVEGWSEGLAERIPVEVRTQVERAVAGGGNVLADSAQGIIQRTVSGVSNAVTLVIGLAVVPFFLFYVLKDREEVVGGVYPLLSPQARAHTHNVIFIVNRVVGSYVRAQLLSATIVGILVFIGLSILGIKFAAILALVAGLFALIPIIGPLLGAVPGLLVTLASSPDKIVWCALVYLVVQLVENNVISPRIQGSAVRLNPAIIMVTFVLSSEIAGLWGVLVAVPLVAATRDVFVYFYSEWDAGVSSEPLEGDPEDATGFSGRQSVLPAEGGPKERQAATSEALGPSQVQ